MIAARIKGVELIDASPPGDPGVDVETEVDRRLATRSDDADERVANFFVAAKFRYRLDFRSAAGRKTLQLAGRAVERGFRLLRADRDLPLVRRRQRVDEIGNRPFRFEIAERVGGPVDRRDVVRRAKRLAEKFDRFRKRRFFAINAFERGGSNVEIVVSKRDPPEFRQRRRRPDRADSLNEQNSSFRVVFFFQRGS